MPLQLPGSAGRLDRDHLSQPAAPATYRGREEVDRYFRDICGRNIQHSVHDLVSTEEALAFVQDCRYPEGNKVVCVTVARLADGKITTQSIAQAWDS
jgi:hypothetical protein